jgi:hypothetical protein
LPELSKNAAGAEATKTGDEIQIARERVQAAGEPGMTIRTRETGGVG